MISDGFAADIARNQSNEISVSSFPQKEHKSSNVKIICIISYDIHLTDGFVEFFNKYQMISMHSDSTPAINQPSGDHAARHDHAQAYSA